VCPRCFGTSSLPSKSMRENDFECFASTGGNTPGTMFPNSTNFDFPEADLRGVISSKPFLANFRVMDARWFHRT